MSARSHRQSAAEPSLSPPEVDDSEREASDEGRERESDRDSAVGSTQGSDTSDSLIRPGDKDDALGDLFFPVEKSVAVLRFLPSDSSSQSLLAFGMLW